MNVLILHGTSGSPESNWLPWLAGELEKLGHNVLRPQLPTPEGQTPENWVKIIKESAVKLGGPSSELVIVAHSRSPLAVCHYLQVLDSPIKACLFVAGFASHLPNVPEPYPTLNNPFDDQLTDWKLVHKKCQKFICFGSDNDPYVPLDIAIDFSNKLNAEFILIPNAGHFNDTSGYSIFPQLLNKIKETI